MSSSREHAFTDPCREVALAGDPEILDADGVTVAADAEAHGPHHVLEAQDGAAVAAMCSRHFETLVEVTSLTAEVQVLGEKMSAWHVRMVHTQADDRSTIEEVHCPGIPDGVVSRVSKRQDKTGRLLEESKLEILGYEVPPSPSDSAQSARRGLFSRRRRTP